MYKLVGLAALAALSGAASAGVVRLDTNAYSFGNGGEFTATPLSGFLGLTGLTSDLSPDSFETFCIERSEEFNPGHSYIGVLNTGATNGSEASGFDPIDARTAYLYTNFRMGTLAGFDYGAGRQASAGELQAAIWYIEGEGGSPNAFVTLANAAVSSSAWTGTGDVLAINMFDQAGGNHQDQLTLVPTPGAVALVGLGALSIGRRRR